MPFGHRTLGTAAITLLLVAALMHLHHDAAAEGSTSKDVNTDESGADDIAVPVSDTIKAGLKDEAVKPPEIGHSERRQRRKKEMSERRQKRQMARELKKKYGKAHPSRDLYTDEEWASMPKEERDLVTQLESERDERLQRRQKRKEESRKRRKERKDKKKKQGGAADGDDDDDDNDGVDPAQKEFPKNRFKDGLEHLRHKGDLKGSSFGEKLRQMHHHRVKGDNDKRRRRGRPTIPEPHKDADEHA